MIIGVRSHELELARKTGGEISTRVVSFCHKQFMHSKFIPNISRRNMSMLQRDTPMRGRGRRAR